MQPIEDSGIIFHLGVVIKLNCSQSITLLLKADIIKCMFAMRLLVRSS